MSLKVFLPLFVFLLLWVSHAHGEGTFLRPWESSSSPVRMSKHFKKKFSDLPLVGIAIGKGRYWSSHYWPLNKGNINLRWNSKAPRGFNLDSPDREEAQVLSEEDLKELAPSEKLDLLNGHYTYPLKRRVAKRTSPQRKDWEGICHGWAMAAMNHAEPLPKTLTNPQGLKIPFGSSDIKALLSYYYAYHYNPSSTHQMGRRCRENKNTCDHDLNAGAFHIVLTNKLGLQGTSFIADIERKREVWNQVVYSYRTEVQEDDLPPSVNSASGTRKVIRVKTNMTVAFNIVKNSWLPVLGTNLQTFRQVDYEYDLDIDSDGEIIGGDWRSEARPDFLWKVSPVKKFYGSFSRLPELLAD